MGYLSVVHLLSSAKKAQKRRGGEEFFYLKKKQHLFFFQTYLSLVAKFHRSTCVKTIEKYVNNKRPRLLVNRRSINYRKLGYAGTPTNQPSDQPTNQPHFRIPYALAGSRQYYVTPHIIPPAPKINRQRRSKKMRERKLDALGLKIVVSLFSRCWWCCWWW